MVVAATDLIPVPSRYKRMLYSFFAPGQGYQPALAGRAQTSKGFLWIAI